MYTQGRGYGVPPAAYATKDFSNTFHEIHNYVVAIVAFWRKCFICFIKHLIFSWQCIFGSVRKRVLFFQNSKVVVTDRTESQWLDLGNQSQACITIPESCGTQGGTISAWIKLGECITVGGIISSFTQTQSGFSFYCKNSEFR